MAEYAPCKKPDPTAQKHEYVREEGVSGADR